MENNDTPDALNVEGEARIQGWVPKENYRGDPEDWIDAETFLRKGREINPLLRANNQRLVKRIEGLESTNTELRTSIQEFKKYHAETEKRAYDRALLDLKAQRKEAIKEGDSDLALELEDRIDQVSQAASERAKTLDPIIQAPPVAVGAPEQLDPEFKSWLGEHTWFGVDKVRTNLTISIGEQLHEEEPELTGERFLSTLMERLRREFPSRFGNPRRGQPEMSAGRGQGDFSDGKKRRVADLPEDAKQAMKKFIAAGLLTEEQYLKDYFGDE